MMLDVATRTRLLAVALAAAACGESAPPATPQPEPPAPPYPEVPAVDSGAAARLEVPDTIRFMGRDQVLVPEVRLFDLRGRALDPAAVQWRSENDAVVYVAGLPGRPFSGLTSHQAGTARVFASVPRPQGEPLVDTAWAVVAPIVTSLVVGAGSQEGLLPGEGYRLSAALRDSAGHLDVLPDSLRRRAVWTSRDSTVARVDSLGNVVALRPGVAVIEAALPALGFRDTALVTVAARLDLPFVGPIVRGTSVGPGLEDFLASADGSTLYVRIRHYRTSELAAYSADGTQLWTRVLGDVAAPLRGVGRDGTLYYRDGTLRAVGRDGQERWSAPCTGAVALGRDDTVYCATEAAVHAYSPAGAELWHRELAGVSALAATGRDQVYAIGASLTALGADGTVRWTRPLANDPVFSLAVDSAGALYLSHVGWMTRAFGADGTLRWELPGVRARLAIAPDRTLILAREDGLLTAVGLDSPAIRWSTRHLPQSWGTPLVGSGRLYVASPCFVFAYDLRTGAPLGRSGESHCAHASGVRFAGGRLYLGDFGGVGALTLGDRPGSEWSQPGGSAARAWRPELP